MNRISAWILHARIAVVPWVLLALTALAQEPGSILGTVTDAESGEALPGVTVALKPGRLGTTTDINGDFQLEHLGPGRYELSISLIGYTTATEAVDVHAGSGTRIDIVLTPSPVHLGEILIQADQPMSAASSRIVREFDLQVRPRRSAHQMLQMTPGLIIAQHAGGGKASVALSAARDVDLFFNFGTGFHSNDARDLVIDRRVADIGESLRRRGMSEEVIEGELVKRRSGSRPPWRQRPTPGRRSPTGSPGATGGQAVAGDGALVAGSGSRVRIRGGRRHDRVAGAHQARRAGPRGALPEKRMSP